MQTTQKSKIDIAINCFRRGGGTESYTFDLVCGLCVRGTEIAVYAVQAGPAVSEYNQMEIYRTNQQIIPKKPHLHFFTRQLVRVRRGWSVPLVACNPNGHTDIFVCGGTHLGYLHNMGERPGLLDRLTIRRSRSNYTTAKPTMVHSHLMQHELTALYGVPLEKIRVIHPPVDTACFRPTPDETAAVRAKYGFRDDETVFLFPSIGHKRKGSDLLADFFEYTNLSVKLAAAGPPLPCPMKNAVGPGFYINMLELHRAVDFTVMASLYELFGLVSVKPVLCGTHVALSNNMARTKVMNDEADFFLSRNCSETPTQAVAQAAALKR